MDFVEPLQALVPGATGRILAVIVHTTIPLSGRTIAQLAGVSPAQATRVLPKLVDLGLVQRRFAPPAILYEFVPDHVAAGPLTTLGALARVFLDRLGEEVGSVRPAPACAAVFGSVARGQGRTDSDVDLLLVRPEELDADDDAWQAAVDEIRGRAQRLSGNRVEILEVGPAEAHRLIRGKRPLWRNIAREAVVVYGRPLHEL